jgi:hypothetical protein
MSDDEDDMGPITKSRTNLSRRQSGGASSIASSVNSKIAEPITGDEIILIILQDSDFTTKASSGFLNKNKGAMQSEVIRGKISRKLGPTNAISLTQSHTSEWISSLTPSPRVNMIYRQHPYDDTRYIGVDIFHTTLQEEMRYIHISIHTLRK